MHFISVSSCPLIDSFLETPLRSPQVFRVNLLLPRQLAVLQELVHVMQCVPNLPTDAGINHAVNDVHIIQPGPGEFCDNFPLCLGLVDLVPVGVILGHLRCNGVVQFCLAGIQGLQHSIMILLIASRLFKTVRQLMQRKLNQQLAAGQVPVKPESIRFGIIAPVLAVCHVSDHNIDAEPPCQLAHHQPGVTLRQSL